MKSHSFEIDASKKGDFKGFWLYIMTNILYKMTNLYKLRGAKMKVECI